MSDSPIVSRLAERRRAAGLAQSAVAERVGVSRQALSAIEAGRQVPSTTLSLQLAAALGCRVEDLFALPSSDRLEVTLAPGEGRRVAIGRVDGRWVAHPLPGDVPVATDGVIAERAGATGRVELLTHRGTLEANVLVAGCAPLLGVLAGGVQRRRSARATWVPANSRHALDLLAAGLVHVAGVHPGEAQNPAAVRGHFPGHPMLVVNLTRWRQGLVLPRHNPRGIRGPDDLLQPDLRVARREDGASASRLLRRLLPAEPSGPTVLGHAAVADLVRCGAADAGVAIESAALAAGLDFEPLSEERFDLVVPPHRAADPPVSWLLDDLCGAAFRAEAARLPGYDLSCAGETATVGGP